MTTKKSGLLLAEVYRQQEEIHRQVVETIARTPDALLAFETRYRRRLRLDTYGHYPKHTEAIRRWRAHSDRRSPASRLPVPHRDNAAVLCASRKSSIFLRRMIGSMSMRVNSKCAHQVR